MLQSNTLMKPYLLGIAGGSGSGKTYFASALQKHFGRSVCEIVYQDSFYFDQSDRFDFDGGSVNFDHPASIDFECLAKCLRELKSGEPSEVPIYDFATHSRRAETERIAAASVILVDGILIFHEEIVRELFDDLVFFETPEDLRFERRLRRDVSERGRKPLGVRNQFYNQVKPMHDAFVEPSKMFAHKIVKDAAEFDEMFKLYCDKLQKLL
jgi:uridine kinase